MDDCLRPPAPSRRIPPSELYEHLESWAESHGIEVLATDFGPGGEAGAYAEDGLQGVVATRGDHYVAVVDRTLPDDERALTLAHELSHILSEFGPVPPRHGVVFDARGHVEDRAYLTESLFGAATGIIRAPERQVNEVMAQGARELGLEPFVIACELAQAAQGSPRPSARPPLGDVRYY